MKSALRRFLRWLAGLGAELPESEPEPAPEPTPEPPPVVTTPDPPKIQRACFLYDGAGTRVMNILAASCAEPVFTSLVQRNVADGCNTIHLYLCNHGDGAFNPVTWFYSDYYGGSVDQDIYRMMRNRIKACWSAGLSPWLWLKSDDSGRMIPYKDVAAHKLHDRQCVSLFGDLAAGWCLGLEIDSTVADRAKVGDEAAYLNGLTNRPIGCHQNPKRFEYSAKIPEVDLCFGQLGWCSSRAQIEKETRRGIAGCGGKPFVALEYDKSSNKQLGQYALAVGAVGYGNG